MSTTQPRQRTHKDYEARQARRESRIRAMVPLASVLAVGSLALGILKMKSEADAHAEHAPLIDVPHKVLHVGDEVNGQRLNTLWDIARASDPGEDHDVRETVAKIKEEQPAEIDAGNLQPGQEILLPIDAQVGEIVDPTAPAEK